MKKYLLSIAALLLGLLAHSQEADELGNYAELSVVARLDANPYFGNEPEFTLGNSSIYTLFTGSASEHFSWALQNHWFSGNSFLGPEADPFDQFKGLGYSDNTNFLDLANVTLTFGGWNFTLGKQCILTDGHEYDDDDWDVYTGLATPLWNGLACYQWGGQVTWISPSESTAFSLQMTTSPFGERPFSSGLWSWSAQWVGGYNWFLPTWSVSLLQSMDDADPNPIRRNNWLVSLGNTFDFGAWTISLDWSNTGGFSSIDNGLLKGNTFHGRVSYMPGEHWNFALQGNYVTSTIDVNVNGSTSSGSSSLWITNNWWNAGAIAEFFPLSDSDALRLHAYVAYDAGVEAFFFKVGLRYNLTFNLW